MPGCDATIGLASTTIVGAGVATIWIVGAVATFRTGGIAFTGTTAQPQPGALNLVAEAAGLAQHGIAHVGLGGGPHGAVLVRAGQRANASTKATQSLTRASALRTKTIIPKGV